MPLTNTDFEQLAEERIADARALLAAQRWSAAYYLAGYAIECALKACLAKRTQAGEFPPPVDVVRKSYYTHDLTDLLKAAGLGPARDAKAQTDTAFGKHWGSVTQWDEAARYALKTQLEAEQLLSAIDDPTSGVLLWIRAYW